VPLDLLPQFIRDHYELHEWRHAAAVLYTDYRSEWDDICAVLTTFRLFRSEVVAKGGRKSPVASRIDGALYAKGWVEKQFATKIVVDADEHASPTHKVDCVKSGVGVEVEWNNKDPFYDRDLNNFRLLFELRVLSVGVIITRASHLQSIFDKLGKGKSYGNSTTHMAKLLPRLEGGGGGGCPVLVVGITDKLWVDDSKSPVYIPKTKGELLNGEDETNGQDGE
jgi:hypothetical protein